jgi:phospho-N-acetylmuramoyl-pentapeptide-transferase
VLFALHALLQKHVSIFRVFGYITFRTALAGITALALMLFLGPWLIRLLRKREIGQEIRSDGPQSHYTKKGTPTMGGIMIIGATLVATLLWGNLENGYLWIAVATMLSFGLVGFIDDYLKIRKKRSLGLRVFTKLGLQVALAAVIGGVLVYLGLHNIDPLKHFDLRLFPPFFKLWTPYLGWFYLPWITFILVGSSNAVNLADGLDGLAIGLTLISAAALTALTYVAGHALWSQYLNIARVRPAGELTVFIGAMTGACLGFLWWNAHPAQVIMGDVGALSLGATLAIVSILIKQELLLFTLAGVFILEALSVLLQVSYFKLSGGKRIFKMAPLHHHFELSGWQEEKIVIRFWIAGIILALFSLSTLKLR